MTDAGVFEGLATAVLRRANLQPILDEIEIWLVERKDIEALRTACDCIIDSGTRADLPRLQRFRDLAVPHGQDVIDDAIFALKRRSLI